MPLSDDEMTPSTPELSGGDARTAGWALSGVTLLVLVVGLLVIRSTRSETEDLEPIPLQPSQLVEAPRETRPRAIVLEADPTPENRPNREEPQPLPGVNFPTVKATSRQGQNASPRSASTNRLTAEPIDRL